jgi:high-affinity nickel-transport protein
MRGLISKLLSDHGDSLAGRIVGLYAILIAVNLGAWAWAMVIYQQHPVLLGTAFLAYGFGLRHAVDADHIAAIDNVTRMLMQEGKRPVAVGFFFSFGHSTVVILATIGIALTATAFKSQFAAFQSIGGTIGTLISSLFLLVIAAMNIVIFAAVYRTCQSVRAGAPYRQEDLDSLRSGSGLLARLFRPMFRMIRCSWHMYPLGFLFGLGFDTATEIGLLGISAAQVSQGLSIWSILVFPALFTAGMSLVDTTDSIVMLGAYGWAFVKPMRKLYYNMTITCVSAAVALLVGGIEALGLAEDQLGLKGLFWDGIARLNDNFGVLGYLIIALFVVSWAASVVVHRVRDNRRLDRARRPALAPEL